MKLTVNKETLLRSLQIVCNVVEKRHTFPVLSNILLVAQDGQLTITGTDLEVEMVATALVSIEQEGEITVPARKFLDIWKKLPNDAPVNLVSNANNQLEISCDKVFFKLSTLPAHDFPTTDTDKLGDIRSVRLMRKELKRIIEKTQFSMAQQDVRQFLQGLMLELNQDSVVAVTADGHRLAFAQAMLDTGISESRTMIVPRKSTLELLKILDDSDLDVQLDFAESHISTEIDDIRFTSKLIDGRFPEYRAIIPKIVETEVILDRNTIKSALERVAILTNEKLKGVKLFFQHDLLIIKANNPEQEEAEETIAVSYAGEDRVVGYNVNYLLDVVSSIDCDQIIVGLSDERNLATVIVAADDTENNRYVVMPMNL